MSYFIAHLCNALYNNILRPNRTKRKYYLKESYPKDGLLQCNMPQNRL